MKRNGFTLVEVIAIVVILAAIFMISVPAISNVSNVDEKKLYNNMVKDLCAAGKSYMYANMHLFPELDVVDSSIQIAIEDLISYGNVDKDLKNPKTGEKIKDNSLKYTVLNDLSLDCTYIEE